MKQWMGKLALSWLLLTAGFAQADCGHSTHASNNYMIPIGRFVLNPETSNESFAFSLLGEIGVRNYRINGTVGTWTTERSRLKLSGEYLSQKLGWGYTTGKSHDWVQQGAVGADWQYLLDGCSMAKAVDVKGYYSYAPSKNLGPQSCVIIGGPEITYLRHIAGSQAYGGSLGTVLMLSEKSRLDVSLDYDYVTYRRIYSSNKKVAGFGGSFIWTSRLPCCMDFSLEGRFRKPFNYFGAKLAWPQVLGSANTRLALFAGWTRGKFHLPNSVQAGVEFVYNFATGCREVVKECCPALWDPCDLNAWALVPAVMMPEVLAIAEQILVIPICIAPTSVAEIPGRFEDFVSVVNYDASVFFTNSGTGGPLVFSATGLADGLVLDPTTGIISGTPNTGFPWFNNTFDIALTATDGCGSTTQNFVWDFYVTF